LRGLRRMLPMVEGSCEGRCCKNRNRHRTQQNCRPSCFNCHHNSPLKATQEDLA